MLKGYICQYWQRYNTFADTRIKQYMYQIACIYIEVPLQMWDNTYLETIFRNYITYFAHLFCDLMMHMLWNAKVDRKNKKLKRNAYNALSRGSLCKTRLQIKTFTNQNLYFSMSSFFQKKTIVFLFLYLRP